jgi:hypothetical protein
MIFPPVLYLPLYRAMLMPKYYDYNYNIYYQCKSSTYTTKYSKYPQSPRQPDDTKLYAKNTENTENSRNALKNVDLAHRTKLYQKKTKSTKLYRKRLTWCKFVGK